jgi:L-amino acid N-acyltransferase YncA
MRIRPAESNDAHALAAIYGHHVLNGLGTFEGDPPPPDEMVRRMAAVQALALPYMVAERDGAVVGFAYGAPFRPRVSYRYTVEDSLYIAPDCLGQGIGKALLTAVIGAAEALGLRQMVAMIGDSENDRSIGLHRACGFEPVGIFRAIGFKHGRWVDVAMMQRPLNTGATRPPEGDGLALGGG